MLNCTDLLIYSVKRRKKPSINADIIKIKNTFTSEKIRERSFSLLGERESDFNRDTKRFIICSMFK